MIAIEKDKREMHYKIFFSILAVSASHFDENLITVKAISKNI